MIFFLKSSLNLIDKQNFSILFFRILGASPCNIIALRAHLADQQVNIVKFGANRMLEGLLCVIYIYIVYVLKRGEAKA